MSRSASLDQIKDQFRKLAFKYHPDINSSKEGKTLRQIEYEKEQNEKFILIKEAYEVLHNPESKRRYDSYIGNNLDQLARETSSRYDARQEAVLDRIRQDIYRKAEEEKR